MHSKNASGMGDGEELWRERDGGYLEDGWGGAIGRIRQHKLGTCSFGRHVLPPEPAQFLHDETWLAHTPDAFGAVGLKSLHSPYYPGTCGS